MLLANEIIDTAKIRRLVDLTRRAEVMVCIDNEKNVDELARTTGNRRT